MMEIVRIGTVELLKEEAARYCDEGRYIVCFGKIYRMCWKAGKIHGKVVATGKGFTRRGRHYAMTPEDFRSVYPEYAL